MTTLSSIRNAAIEDAGAGGLTVYATKEDLPSSGLTAGDQAYVSANSRLYVSNGSGWYNIALINATPSLSIDPTGTIVLSTAGETTTITLTATDSDNAVAGLTYSVESDGSFGGLASISQDSSVFTITPLSEDSATTSSAVLTFKASDGINFGSGDRTLTLTFKVENSNYTTLLLKADSDGTDNQVDASTNAHTITENGNVTSTALSPYHPGGYSVYFDGSGDYLNVTNSTDFDFGTGDFTVEGWYYATDVTGDRYLISFSKVGNTHHGVNFNNGSWRVGVFNDSLITGTTGVEANVWHHFAWVRESGVMKFYIDGTQVGSDVAYATEIACSGTFSVGSYAKSLSYGQYSGYLRDIRIVKGTAVYTSTFTSPTAPLTAITNTVFLTCHLPYFADGSTSGHTFAVTGNPTIERFGPYDYLPYTKADHGGSVYFDGTGDYLDVATATAADFGTGDFTVELWWYPTTPTANGVLISGFNNANNSSNNVTDFYLGVGSNFRTPHVNTNFGGTWTTRISTTDECDDNAWNHVAYVRNGNTGNIYINGKKGPDYSLDAAVEFNNPFSSLWIFRNRQTDTNYGQGYLQDLRIVKGTAVYTANFTPPTSPLTAITNTELLTCTNKNDIWDAAFGAKMSKGGNTTASGTEAKFTTSGRGAIYFDGTSDYLDIYPASTLYALGSKDFTIDMWVNFTVASSDVSYRRLFMADDGGNIANNFQILVDVGGTFGSTGAVLVWAQNGSNTNSNISSTTAINDGNWHHIAVSRTSNTVRLFVDGTRQGTNLTSWTHGLTTAVVPRLGSDATTTSGNYQGYIQDFRLLVGKSLYTTDSSITVPTAEFDG